MQHINRLKPAFVVVCGDLVHHVPEIYPNTDPEIRTRQVADFKVGGWVGGWVGGMGRMGLPLSLLAGMHVHAHSLFSLLSCPSYPPSPPSNITHVHLLSLFPCSSTKRPNHPPTHPPTQSIMSTIDDDIPLLCVCGNHDVGNSPTQATIQRYKNDFGK